MPLEGFYCTDGEQVSLQDCEQECRLGERCLTLPSLVSISMEREWNGVASTTQLIDGTMLVYLKLTQPYYVVPDSRAFMLRGTEHHQALEKIGKELGLPAEIPLSVDRDIFDLIEFEKDKLVLTDYKLWGSFKVAKALGMEEVGKKPHPTEVYKTTSKWGREGEAKMVPVFKENPELADMWETEWQLNRYRVMLKDLGVIIHRMQLQITVRDGGLFVAHNRGLFRNIYKIPVTFRADGEVKAFFAYKNECLQDALANGWDSPCTVQECWNGIRCKDFCDVAHLCSKGQLVKSIGGK